MQYRRLAILLTAIFSCLVFTASGQDSLVPIQDWTSADGKVIHAELTKFEAGTAQFRTKEGRRHSIADEKFSLRDQATILIARIKNQYEVSYQADINTEFFYSKQVAKNRRRDKIHAYLGFGPKRFNLGILIPSTRVDLRNFDEIQIVAAENLSAGYSIDTNSIYSSGSDRSLWTRVRIDIQPNKNEAILPVLQKGLSDNSLTFLAKGKGGEETFELSDSERNSIREVVKIYSQTAKLVNAGFIKRERISTQTPNETPESKTESSEGDDLLKPFREQLSKNKYGLLKMVADANSEPIEVAGLGYLGTDVVIRNASDEVKRIPITELDEASRKKVYEQRIVEFYGNKPLELDSGTLRYFPPDWDATRRVFSQGFIFSILSDGRPALVLNTWTGSFDGVPLTEILVRGNNQERNITIPCEPAESKQRNRKDRVYTTTFLYLDSAETEKVRELANSESIELRLNANAKSTSFSLKDDELATSREAIALYFWYQNLK